VDDRTPSERRFRFPATPHSDGCGSNSESIEMSGIFEQSGKSPSDLEVGSSRHRENEGEKGENSVVH